jgi:hypothetical protein
MRISPEISMAIGKISFINAGRSCWEMNSSVEGHSLNSKQDSTAAGSLLSPQKL